jgi:tetratricopeptide (TPR) repeat protein
MLAPSRAETAARVAIVIVLVGCLPFACTGAPKPAGVSPAALAALETQMARHPDDPALNLRLAKAYYSAGRFAATRRAVGTTLRLQPANDEAQVYLGLSYEGLTQYDSARAVYSGLLASRPRRAVRRLLAGRLAMLTRLELRSAAREAIARESLLTQTPPDPNTVAVMTFRYTGGDSAFRPLERGLAALVVTDLSRVSQLRIVERARLQALLDELQLAESGRVDLATGARSGRLVRASEVVQGQFSIGPTSQLRMDATVVRATDAQVTASGSNADQLQALLDIEKAVVFQLLAKLGITLTPAERVAISERPTRDIQAFLLYSRGLETADGGDFAAAAGFFGAAARRDPGFGAAAQQAAATQAASLATGADLTAAVGGSGGRAAPTQGTLATGINSTVPTGVGTLGPGSSTTLTPPSTDPNRICEGAACDGPARAILIGTVIIILKLP